MIDPLLFCSSDENPGVSIEEGKYLALSWKVSSDVTGIQKLPERSMKASAAQWNNSHVRRFTGVRYICA
jgi:hypothetical protein